MNRVGSSAGRYLIAALGCAALTSPPASGTPIVKYSMTDTYGLDLTGLSGKVSFKHEGAHKGVVGIPIEATGATFLLGTGQSNSIANHVAAQNQISKWSMQAVFANGKTRFKQKANNSNGLIHSGATVPTTPGWSKSTTTFSASGTVNGMTIKLGPVIVTGETGAAPAGGAQRAGQADVYSDFTVSHQITLDDASIMGIELQLWGESGGLGVIDETGLTLDVSSVGGMSSSQVPAGFSIAATNFLDPLESYAWSASLRADGQLIVSGVDPSLFQIIGTGIFLPIADFPGGELNATVGAGEWGDAVTTIAFEQVVPEPATLGLLALGGPMMVLRRRR